MKLTIFSGAKNKGNQAKLLTDSENTTKINVWSGWALFLILLTFGSGFQTMTKQNNEQFQKLQKQDAHITIMAVFQAFQTGISVLYLSKAVGRICFVKKAFLEISQNSQVNTCARVCFLKRRIQRRCFSVNFAKFLRTPFLTEHLRCLLLTFQ